MAKLFTSAQIHEIDAYTINNEPIASIDLMERAVIRLSEWILERFDKNSAFSLFAGPGNNGGDTLALARILYGIGYNRISVYLLQTSSHLSADAEINRKRLAEQTDLYLNIIESEKDFPDLTADTTIIDGLFGSGLSRPPEGIALQLIQFLNHTSCKIIAIDIPSGLFGEDNSENKGEKIKADYTLTFQFPKLAFFFPENDEFVGEWHVLDIGLHKSFIESTSTPYNYILEQNISGRLIRRKKFSHKGSFGHGLLIAGSTGMMGAAVLSARASLRSGAGLLTAHVPLDNSDILQIAVPESLISIDPSKSKFTQYPPLEKYSAIGVGPGLGKDPVTKSALIGLLNELKVPVVLDADALNLLSTIPNWKNLLPRKTILTPHLKEFERLFGSFDNSFKRMNAQLVFSKENDSVIVLKGAHTCITTPEGDIWFNTTGNPGMAKGGSGDVLTGMILGLIAQGYKIADAALISVFMHGKAGDIAASLHGQYSMIASDISDNIGTAFNVIEEKKDPR
jgi:NAD(P)H-hydrate epimerase